MMLGLSKPLHYSPKETDKSSWKKKAEEALFLKARGKKATKVVKHPTESTNIGKSIICIFL